MKLRIVLVPALVCALVLSLNTSNIFAQEQGVDYATIIGTWEIESEGRDGETRKYEWVFSAKDDNLTATIPTRGRGGSGGGAAQEVEDVKLDGENLSFVVEREGRNGPIKINYIAKISDGRMTGTMGIADRFSRDFSGKLASAKDDEAPTTPHFAKQVEVFGIYVYATNTVADEKLLHAAGILAQYIDNDEDGVADSPKIMKAMIDGKGAITMRKTGGERVTGPRPRGQGLSDEQTRPNALADGVFDTAWEEVLHMITDSGWGGAYPEVFGRVPGTEIANAMDLARGGHYPDKRPEKHPDGAWYTYYDDGSCDYDCMMSEYIYWAFTSFIGAQDIPGREEQIGNEWRPNTKEKLKKQDPTIFAILTRPEYNLATKVPNGKYKGKKLVIEPYRP